MKTSAGNLSNIGPSNDWELIRELETRLLQAMSIQESLQQYQELQASLEWQIQQTAGLFETNRREALIELQDRLQKLAAWI